MKLRLAIKFHTPYEWWSNALLPGPKRCQMLFKQWPGGGGGDSHMKQTGMLIVSRRGVNFGFWSRLGCSGQSANILCCQGPFRVPRRNTELCEEKQKSNFPFNSFCLPHCFCDLAVSKCCVWWHCEQLVLLTLTSFLFYQVPKRQCMNMMKNLRFMTMLLKTTFR